MRHITCPPVSRSIEADLAMGASRWEALEEHIRDTLTLSLMPALNSLSVSGLVSIPGMMTGQIIAGKCLDRA